MIDRYTKVVLTVIAVSLAGICAALFTPRAIAQSEGCGAVYKPCYVTNSGTAPLGVHAQ